MKRIIVLTVVALLNTFQHAQAQMEEDSPDYGFEMQLEKWTAGWQVVAVNYFIIPVQVKWQNEARDSTYQECLIGARDKRSIKTYDAQEREWVIRDFNENNAISFSLGDPTQIHPDTNYQYRMPFGKGIKYNLDQTWNGPTSHRSKASKYALDFTMPIGSPVHAAREGLVIEVKEHFKESGGRNMVQKANRILIQHIDGTIAAYAHLDYEGAVVEVGDQVKRGQQIGLSGNTGFSNGPHLHFVVRKEWDEAIPIYFKGYKRKKLKAGKKYKVK